MNTDEIKQLADLARVTVTDQQAGKLGEDFKNILSYIDQLSAVDVTGVEPFNGPVVNHFRDDVAVSADHTSHELVVNNFPDGQDGFLKVPKIL